jgi:hypothetical protein
MLLHYGQAVERVGFARFYFKKPLSIYFGRGFLRLKNGGFELMYIDNKIPNVTNMKDFPDLLVHYFGKKENRPFNLSFQFREMFKKKINKDEFKKFRTANKSIKGKDLKNFMKDLL